MNYMHGAMSPLVLGLLVMVVATTAASSIPEYDSLWNQHVVWTREFAKVAIAHDDAEVAAIAGRLMRNQDDIGAALGAQLRAPTSGAQVATLLKEHISLAGELLASMIHGNSTAEGMVKWQQNADVLAEKMASLGQSSTMWRDMLRQHLDLTHKEFQFLLNRDHAADMANYDAILLQAQMMADAMSKATVAIDNAPVATPVVVAASPPVVGAVVYPGGGSYPATTEVVYPNGQRVVYVNGYEDSWWVGAWVFGIVLFFFAVMVGCFAWDDPSCRRGK